MLTIQSEVSVPDVTCRQITDLLLEPTDRTYRQWWPGTHLRFHIIRRGAADHRGDVVLMDEYVGRRRIRQTAVVIEALPGQRIVWQFGSRVRLPARLTLDLAELPEGVEVHHTISAGFSGLGRVLDPLLRLYFTRRFAAAMHDHVRREFRRLPV